MTFMKKHPVIHIDFSSAVKLTKKEEKKILLWITMAKQVMEKAFREKGLVHSSWMQNVQSFHFSVLLCGEQKIRKLNQEYRNKDKVTDVLSFPTYPSLRVKRTKTDMFAPNVLLGDLAICHQKTLKQSKEFDIGYWDEFIHLFMHGAIHLLGYDHEISKKEEKVMQGWETWCLDQFSKIKQKKRGRLRPLFISRLN